MKAGRMLAIWPLASRVASLPQQALVGLVRAYRLLLSPWLGSGCRFEPSCSTYSLAALQQHGAIHGSYLTLHRLVRCQPWCDGGNDPVPPASTPFSAGHTAGALFSRLVARRADQPSSSEKTSS